MDDRHYFATRAQAERAAARAAADLASARIHRDLAMTYEQRAGLDGAAPDGAAAASSLADDQARQFVDRPRPSVSSPPIPLFRN
ncbi:hypothetical protein IAG41_15690 [Sphingomonas sp. JC676]|uniref:hypothetical protein n=1 Tax=Sphingomonas sp. JC676 TaxID=2768065 RepID=UPI0016586C02|nr:hypothetical protein [Sphingomonas sp. JC676]MBC9033838.1 hypothetical protein [Sphingomonas sp. JC676]